MRKRANQDLAPNFVGAVGNAVSILRSLAHSSEPAGVAAIARNAGVSVSTCFNILRTLASERLVVFDPESKAYRIGLGMLEFSVPLLGANQADVIRPELKRLAGERSCLICLWQLTENDRILLIDRVSPPRTVRVDISHGSRLPAFVVPLAVATPHTRISADQNSRSGLQSSNGSRHRVSMTMPQTWSRHSVTAFPLISVSFSPGWRSRPRW